MNRNYPSSQYGANPNAANAGSGIKSLEITHKPLVILRCKVIIIGDACVGKSALTQVFESNGATYPKNYLMTIGCDLVVKQVPIPDTNYLVELFLYDCSGQSIFNLLDQNTKYYEDAAAIMTVYSVSSRESLQSSAKWISNAKGAISSSTNPISVLVGNKSDLRDGTIDSRAEVTFTEGKEFAQSLGCQFFETSAANNQGVEEPFKHIAQEFYKRFEDSAQSFDEVPGRSGGRY